MGKRVLVKNNFFVYFLNQFLCRASFCPINITHIHRWYIVLYLSINQLDWVGGTR